MAEPLDQCSTALISAARFPAAELLEEFEFSARPSIDKPLLLHLIQADYLDHPEE